MKPSVIIPVLTGVFAILFAGVLYAYWGGASATWVRARGEAPPLMEYFALACGAVSLSIAFAVYWISGHATRGMSKLSEGRMTALALACLAPGIWGGMHLWTQNRKAELIRKDEKAQSEIESKLDRLKQQGRYDEMVQEMERVLAIHEELLAEVGLGRETCNIGFSYLFVSLNIAAEDLPPLMGWGLAGYLYDVWRDQSDWNSVADALSEAMTRSRHPLLRALGFWVEQDRAAFEREAMAGAQAGDRRMDALALVAACWVSQDRKLSLEKVRPILDRGVGLGRDIYPKTSSEIRAFLEGSRTKL